MGKLALERSKTGFRLLSREVVRKREMLPVPHGQMGVPYEKLQDVKYPSHLERYGGVLRYGEGTPEGMGGQIKGHLRDMPGPQRQPVPQDLPGQAGGLFSLQGIGAMASVANLAVSVVGFYIMNKKLNRIEEQLTHLEDEIARMEGKFDRRFQDIEQRLVRIEYALEGLREGQEKILKGIEEVKDQNDARWWGKVEAVVERMEEYHEKGESPPSARVADYRDTLAEVRKAVKRLVEKWCLDHGNDVESAGFVRGTGYYQLWVATVAVEAKMLREVGETRTAAEFIQSRLEDWYMEAAQDAVIRLVEEKPGVLMSGAFSGRISASQYLSLLEFRRGERFDEEEAKIVMKEADDDQKEVFGSDPKERLERMESYEPRPRYSRTVEAYNLKEMGQRLDTMALEYEMCAESDLSMEEWEGRELEAEESGELHVVPMQ